MAVDTQPHAATTLAADLEIQRLRARATQLEAIVRELRSRARFYEAREGRAPVPLRHAIAGFVLDLRALDRRLAELTGEGTARSRTTRHFRIRARTRA